MQPRRYKYPSFLDGRSIRLFKFTCQDTLAQDGHSMGSDGDILSIQMSSFPIGLEPQYNALSYTWGRPEDAICLEPPNANGATSDGEAVRIRTSYVCIGGENHDITTNLLEALNQMSASYPDSYLWVDALCINQDSLDEREVHVAIMNQIYRNAQNVLVWLGKDMPESSSVFAMVNRVAAVDDQLLTVRANVSAPDELIPGLGPFPSENPNEIWTRYIALYERRWFHRGWVIQEVALAKNAVAHWGPLTIPWQTLVAGSRIFLPDTLRKVFFAPLRQRALSVSQPTSDGSSNNDGVNEALDNLPLGRNALRIGLMQNACFSENCDPLLVVEICTGRPAIMSAESILLHLMRMARDFQWSDPRDRVYSLFGLVRFTAAERGFANLDIAPEYGAAITEAHVLTAAASAIIRRSGWLGIISQVSDVSSRKAVRLPSWVPDFSRSPNFSMGRTNPFEICGFGRLDKEASNIHYRFSGTSLLVEGVKMGEISKYKSLRNRDRAADMMALLELAYQSTLPRGVDRADVLWRTMIWDVYGHDQPEDTHPAAPELADSFVVWVASVLQGGGIHGEEWLLLLLQDLGHDLSNLGIGEENNPPVTQPISTTDKLRLASQEQGSQARRDSLESGGSQYRNHASGVTWRQQLFLMDVGYLGMGPMSGGVRDEVWAIKGCSFPMVLRKIARESGDTFIVMGRAYVHGVMHGEAIKSDTTWSEICLD